jgi:hypothetical protein
MHMFVAFHVLHFVFGALILSFFILFAASKAEGLVALFGNVLGVLLLLCALLGVVGAVMMHGEGDKGREWMDRMHGGAWGPPWMHDEHAPPASPSAPAAPAKPAPATPSH